MGAVYALIPARAGSKGVPNKNVRPLGGRPLLEWSIAASLRSMLIDRVIVSTDSSDYADLARGFGAEAPFLRPEAIANDRSTDFEFVEHALDWFAAHGEEPEHIVHIRPTSPFRDPDVVDSAIETFLASTGRTALRSAHEMSESAYKSFEITEAGVLKRLGAAGTDLDSANNARQAFPKTYEANGYVDVLATDFIRANGIIHGDAVLPYVTERIVEVDTEADFRHLEFLLADDNTIFRKLFTD